MTSNALPRSLARCGGHPSNNTSSSANKARYIPHVMAASRNKAAGRVPRTPTASSDSEPVSAGLELHPEPALSFPVVCVGASAGGLEAFTQLLSTLPTDTGMAFVLVTHLSPTHASHLAEILSRATRMPVNEVKGEPQVQPNCVYVIPPDSSMIIAHGSLKLLPRHRVDGRHHPIDLFLESLAQDQKHKSIAVILSGTGSDGTLGMDEIKAAGGITFAQDDSAAYDGMPRSAMTAGTVDFRLSPAEIARELGKIARHAYVGTDGPPERIVDGAQTAQIVRTLHQTSGVDFTNYKAATLRRGFVIREVDTGGLMQGPHDLRGLGAVDDALRRPVRPDVRMPRDLAELAGDLRGRQPEVDCPRRHGAAGHPVVGGRVVLRERDAAGRLDLIHPQRAVAAGARQNDGDGFVFLVLRQRLEKQVDRMMPPIHPVTR